MHEAVLTGFPYWGVPPPILRFFSNPHSPLHPSKAIHPPPHEEHPPPPIKYEAPHLKNKPPNEK